MPPTLTAYQFVDRLLALDFDGVPALASYPIGDGDRVLAWVAGPHIALAAEVPGRLRRVRAEKTGRALADRRGVDWLGGLGRKGRRR